jgi:hypothetical protein
MATTTIGHSNHYDVLGLEPGASSEEVTQAFARQLSPLRPHALGGIARASIAYEVLRNPERRRAYDESLGLVARPQPKQTVTISGFGVGSFIAAGLRQPSGTAIAKEQPVPPAPVREEAFVPTAPPPPRVEEPRLAETPVEYLPAPGSAPWIEERSSEVEWKRPGLTIGLLFAGVALVGAMAGVWSQREVAQSASASVPLPAPVAPRKLAKTAIAPAMPTAPVAAQGAQAATPATVRSEPERIAKARPEPAPEPEQLADLSEELTVTAVPATETAEPVATETAPPEAAAPAAATMPLPSSVVARTIHKIGYPCGRVASTAAAGSAGVFTVTCTSGDSYRAAPVNGRYHFRRLGKR